MTAFLGEVRRREIDGDPLRRQGEPDRVQRAAHPLAALGHRLVGQTDNGEMGQAGSDLDLDVHGAGLDAFEGDRGDPREHENPRLACRHSSRAEGRRQEQ